MYKDKQMIHVTMLGTFSIQVGDRMIIDNKNQTGKTWNLLEYLITFRGRDISINELIDAMWSDNEVSSNPSGALKTLLCRTRHLLTPLGCYSPQQLIVQRRGSYSWNTSLPITVDADQFRYFAGRALTAKDGVSDKIRLTNGLRAFKLYEGDFLPKSCYDPWVVPLYSYYHTLYQKLIHKIMDIMLRSSDYEGIIPICQKASEIEPYDEDIHYNLIYSLYKTGRQNEAMEHYNDTISLFYNRFAITPSEHLKKLYNIIRDVEHGVVVDLSLIQHTLLQEYEKSGPFFCEYAVFSNLYQLEARSISRTGESIYLCMLTVSDLNGHLPELPLLTKAMETLNTSIRASLRRGDVYCRSSVSQFMILLPAIDFESGELVLKRICMNHRKRYARKDLTVSYELQPVTPNEVM